MTKKPTFIILLLYSCFSFSQTDYQSLLPDLDKAIKESDLYVQKRENRIDSYKEELKKVTAFSNEEYLINTRLHKEYRPFICDSAIFYLNKNIEIAEALGNQKLKDESQLHLAYLLGSSGMYKEAVDMLLSIEQQKLDVDLFVDYYNTHYHVYAELAFYTQDKKKADIYRHISETYQDSLNSVITPQHPLYLEIKEIDLRNSWNMSEALRYNDLRLEKTAFGEQTYALIMFHRALIYGWQGNRDVEMYYLALSALSDIQTATKDHASLWMLAQALFEKGDIERAYNYIRFSWDETAFYNARLRSLQSAAILSLIDKTYQAKIETQNKKLQDYLILTSALAVLLVVALFFIYKQIKRLSVARKKLQTANSDLKKLNEALKQINNEMKLVNEQLQSTNAELSDSNRIKEEYIGRFIGLCSTYIDKLDAFRKKINKKLNNGEVDDVRSMTRSQDILEEELEGLYANFDSAFLQLFPDFVEKVNKLLQPEERFTLKKMELLNAELRILALIRLGISDSSQIADFLRYSLTTIYNYRSKMKSKAIVSKEDFEKMIMQIR